MADNTPETIVEMFRLSALSDGVYAIALTLLVLDIRIPEEVLAADLSHALVELAPKFLVYLISFIVIGGAWGSHQRMLSQIRRGDGLLVWFNLLSLLFVTLLPAASAVLGRFPGSFPAIVCFALDVIFIQLSALWLWRHASKSSLTNAALDPRIVVGIGRRLLLSAVAFALSIPLALWNSNIVYALWIGLFLLIFATDWLSWQQATNIAEATIPLDGARRGQINVVHGAGILAIQSGAPSDILVAGTFGGGLNSQITRENDLLTASMKAADRRGFLSYRYPWSWGPANTLDWTLNLNPEIPLALKIETGAGETDLDLSALHVIDLRIETSASSVNLTLPAHVPQTAVSIQASTASLIIYIPANVAALIRVTKALSTVETDLGRFAMIEDGREYRSMDYDTAEFRADLQIELAVGSLKIF